MEYEIYSLREIIYSFNKSTQRFLNNFLKSYKSRNGIKDFSTCFRSSNPPYKTANFKNLSLEKFDKIKIEK